jgi:predicted transcriptional regulator
MAGKQSPTFTQVELEFMQVMWDAGRELSSEDFVEKLAARGHKLKGGTVRKMLERTIAKGYVARRREGRKHLYWPLVDRIQGRRHMLLDLLKRAFGGNEALMVGTLVESRQGREADMKRIEKLLEGGGEDEG